MYPSQTWIIFGSCGLDLDVSCVYWVLSMMGRLFLVQFIILNSELMWRAFICVNLMKTWLRMGALRDISHLLLSGYPGLFWDSEEFSCKFSSWAFWIYSRWGKFKLQSQLCCWPLVSNSGCFRCTWSPEEDCHTSGSATCPGGHIASWSICPDCAGGSQVHFLPDMGPRPLFLVPLWG